MSLPYDIMTEIDYSGRSTLLLARKRVIHSLQKRCVVWRDVICSLQAGKGEAMKSIKFKGVIVLSISLTVFLTACARSGGDNDGDISMITPYVSESDIASIPQTFSSTAAGECGKINLWPSKRMERFFY